MLIITCWTYILLIAILHQIISILLVYHFVVVLFKMSTMYTSINNWDSMSIGTRPTFQMSCAKMILDVSITNVCVCVCVFSSISISIDDHRRWHLICIRVYLFLLFMFITLNDPCLESFQLFIETFPSFSLSLKYFPKYLQLFVEAGHMHDSIDLAGFDRYKHANRLMFFEH